MSEYQGSLIASFSSLVRYLLLRIKALLLLAVNLYLDILYENQVSLIASCPSLAGCGNPGTRHAYINVVWGSALSLKALNQRRNKSMPSRLTYSGQDLIEILIL